MHSVWAGTPGVPLARCGCSVLNDRGTEAEETSPGVLHHAILRRRVGLIAPSFCAQYEHPWHRAACIHYVVSTVLLQAAVFMYNRWWVLVRLLASKCDSWGEFLTPVFWTWYARSGVTYFACTPLRDWRGFRCCSLSEGVRGKGKTVCSCC